MSNSYLSFFFVHSYSHSYKSSSEENLKSAIFSYLHHQHPTYTLEHLIRSGEGREEEDKGKGERREISLKHCALSINRLRHPSAEQRQDTLEDMDKSDEGKGRCTYDQIQTMDGSSMSPCQIV